MLYFDPKQLNGATIQPFRPLEKQTASSPKVTHISFFSFQILHLIMFVVKPAATSFLVVIVLGSILEGHVANAHNRRRSDETIRRRTLRGNDGHSPPPPLAEISATIALEDVLVETASFWGRNLQGSGSFGKGKEGVEKAAAVVVRCVIAMCISTCIVICSTDLLRKCFAQPSTATTQKL